MRMRKVLIAIAVLIVLVWLIPWDLQPDDQQQIPPPVAPVVATPESGSTPATDNASRLSDQTAANDPVEPPVPFPDQVALSPMTQKAVSWWSLQDPELDGIDQAFAAERVDPSWATGMEGNILGQLARANLQLVTMQVECRTSLCRVQLISPPSKPRDPGAFRELERDLGLELWRVMGSVDEIGTPTSVAYLARPGCMSPDPRPVGFRDDC